MSRLFVCMCCALARQEGFAVTLVVSTPQGQSADVVAALSRGTLALQYRIQGRLGEAGVLATGVVVSVRGRPTHSKKFCLWLFPLL